ncbi:hypothetical protein GCM10010271_33170 [Streptomyces kurssanovii]|nr:hypothetical protein GCM10010271_33170 [Streptomyces kurssanovii]
MRTTGLLMAQEDPGSGSFPEARAAGLPGGEKGRILWPRSPTGPFSGVVRSTFRRLPCVAWLTIPDPTKGPLRDKAHRRFGYY